MASPATEFQRSSSPPLPADHVLNSGAVIFPGAFDQHGCPLVVFPAGAQQRLPDLGEEDVANFIHYFLRAHNKHQEKGSLVSLVADLRQATVPTARFVADLLLLLELNKRTVHTLYVVQPKKRDVLKLLTKALVPSGSKQYIAAPFKRVVLKELFELSNHIDRSQLTASLGGYLVYCHRSWVTFVKEIDAFVQEFLLVVQKLPSCISTLQAISQQPVPSDFEDLTDFCLVNEARFHELRRELGLDVLLRHCEGVVAKLRYPENAPCYQAMAGTSIFVQTSLDMLQNYSRITSAVEKVELLWKRAFSKARLQLHVLQLQREAQQITEQMASLRTEKLQPHAVEIAKDAARAEQLMLEFETSTYASAMVLAHRAEDVIHKTTMVIPLGEALHGEGWVDELEGLKESFCSAVELLYQTLRAVANFHRGLSRAKAWYSLVLCQNFLQDLLCGGTCDTAPKLQSPLDARPGLPVWKQAVGNFLKRNPSPETEELVQLAHLANVIPEAKLQQSGKQLSHRCMILRKLLTCPGAVSLHDLKLALQWQYDFLSSNCQNIPDTPLSDRNESDGIHFQRGAGVASVPREQSFASNLRHMKPSGGRLETAGPVPATGKPPSLSSFDSGFDCAGSSHLDVGNGNCNGRESLRPKSLRPRVHELFTSVSDSEEHQGFESGSVESPFAPSIQIIPKITVDSLNFEIKVKRTSTLPKNPWLGLPVEDLENSYTVTITPNTSHHRDSGSPSLSKSDCGDASGRCRDRPAQTDVWAVDPKAKALHPQESFEDPELSLIHNVLSSTISEPRDVANCTEPSLMWDTYDFHDLGRDPAERLNDLSEVSLSGWELREQEGLREVEKILDRTAGILLEEENVLAQEEMLDCLLKTEHSSKPWMSWGNEQSSVMSPKELMESGVIGFKEGEESPLDCASRNVDCETQRFVLPQTTEDPVIPGSNFERHQSSRGVLSQELRGLHALEERIMEENLKIHEFRRQEEEILFEKPPRSSSKDREKFLRDLEKEKREVEKMERTLHKGPDKEGKLKKREGRSRKVVTCSVMGRAPKLNLEDSALCDRLFSSARKNVTLDLTSGPPAYDDSGQIVADSPKSEQLGDGEGLETEGTAWNFADKVAASEVTVVSLAPELSPDPGEFDPGGDVDAPPVPKPRTMLGADLVLGTEQKLDGGTSLFPLENPEEFRASSDLPEISVPPKPKERTKRQSLITNPEVIEHSNNNNNNPVLEGQLPGSDHSEVSPRVSCDPADIPAPGPPFQFTDSGACRSFSEALPVEHFEVNAASRALADSVNGETCDLDVTEPSTRYICSSPASQQITSTRAMSSFKTPIVLDTGSGLMKAGFSDQGLPTAIFPTVIGLPKYEEVMNGSADREMYIGHDAQHMRGVLTLKHPMKNGIVQNWDEMERIWHHAFQQLNAEPDEHPVMLTEAAMNPRENRQRMVELMFEAFCVPLTYVAMQAVLALYAAGRTTGVVFDSGDGVSHSVPVFDGYCLPHAVQRFNLAGMDVTLHLTKLLQERGVSMRTSAELEIVRDIKEKHCYVSLDHEAELARGRAVYYTMPDGQVINLVTERFRAPEILFKPELIGREHYGIHESIFKSILQSDIDLRRSLVGNVVLSGGNTLLAGLPERLQTELKKMAPGDLGNCVRVTSPIDRDFSVWSGGAVLANLPSFSSAWISQEEYDEFGPEIVFRKCF
ncbi:uncharacterized protein LOC114802958 isoform X2 [Denticeps clupeoides]|uniref:CRAL-TRIO domain-containing protein n=1 Tax=Denticeps clupeoides TaxID=299321 RepID=A0AAY4DJ13_9TELE|nr:uncharacterized protein LOC114802958 isoform X2 [Denticeps clupeoides]